MADDPGGYRPDLYISTYVWLVVSKLHSYAGFFYDGKLHNMTAFSLFVLLSVLFLLGRRSRSDVALLSVAGVLAGFYFVVFVNTISIYLAYIFPLLALAIAAGIFGLLRKAQDHPHSGVAAVLRSTALVMAVVAVGFGTARGADDLAKVRRYAAKDPYRAYIAKLKAVIPPNAVVMGQPTWFYGFAGQRYYADRFLAWIARTKSDAVRQRFGYSVADTIRRAGMEYLIIDAQLFNRMINEPTAMNSIPENEMIPFLERECELAGTIEDEYYGFSDGEPRITKVYRIKKPAADAR
jgi:hypothetical protein